MITALDTSVLLDVLRADRVHGPTSAAAIRRCRAEGALIACDIVWAEVSAAFPSPEEAAVALDTLEVAFDPMDRSAAGEAGAAWRSYRDRGGPRVRIVADFLIGIHASRRADRLLTRDRGFYRSSFEGLAVLDPGAPS